MTGDAYEVEGTRKGMIIIMVAENCKEDKWKDRFRSA